ncbi:YybH family protein [Methylophaga pinxianii]|uniref:YybH family protein n=1 Tax=Methylophaga pinxianii TaxID=2881052 RepID=UPI001CF38007|nr:SgcJ/EcaC family oxidoreductase [Methylophaga pinxianii]MCB2426994.1 SgcJ/EcaC family oxidoreductase [Methylophaga pinxianii]UPH46960.1 SgcJ/EcaC family oxidoreductase [Methylophaga pinxianii]
MKVLKRFLPLGLVVLAISACNQPAADYDAQEVVNAANEQWNAAFNEKNLDALVDLYAAQATLSAGDGNVLNGQQEISDLFNGFFENGLYNHQIETIATYSSAGQVSQLANWSADVEGENGETMSFKGVLMTVLQQNEQGEWEVVSHIWNMAQ